MINIVIPMAGAGSRFVKAGYTKPKPLIDVLGMPMIQVVVNNLRPKAPHRFIFICQRDHVIQFDLCNKLREYAKDCELVELEGLTEGAACTVLKAADLINNNQPLMIANSDQYIDASIDEYLGHFAKTTHDGIIMTMTAADPKWSYVVQDCDGRVVTVVEKEVVSSEATVGIYNFRRGSDFVSAARKMIKRNERVNGEFYVAPVYNTLISEGASIGVFNIGDESGNGMHGLGTPLDLDKFVSNPRATSWVS